MPQPDHGMPSSIYAMQLPRALVQQDLRELRLATVYGVDRSAAIRSIEQRHYHHNARQTAASTRYIRLLSESIQRDPVFTLEQHMARLQPSAEEKRLWEPLTKALPLDRAVDFNWQRELEGIQTYRSATTGAWLHIDANGQFYNPRAQLITREEALRQPGQRQ